MAMQWQGLKLPVIFLAFVLGLALAFGGQWAYKQYNFNQPLNKVLAENKLVAEFKVEEDPAYPIIKVKLSKDSKNLMEAYQELYQITKDVMGNTPYELQLMNDSDSSLEEAYYESHHVIYQAQVNGNFPEVLEVVQKNSKKQGAEGKVFVDQNNIYVQITKPDGHFLYKVIPRTITSGQGGGQVVKGN